MNEDKLRKEFYSLSTSLTDSMNSAIINWWLGKLDRQISDLKQNILLEMTFIERFDAEDMATIENIINKINNK